MNTVAYRATARALPLVLAALLPACKSVDVPKIPGVTPYRMVIQQGNFISQEMVAQLKPGMSKEQVRFVLGTPLVTDIFHADRWDYVFFRELADGKREQRNLSVVFENSKLARVLGDLMPAEGTVRSSGFETQMKPETKAKPVPKPEAKPVADAAKPAAEASAPPPASAQNWTTADQEKKNEPAPAAKADEPPPAEEKKEPGFLDRLRQKIGL
jgi:outer membrane protein assembly factor BamE